MTRRGALAILSSTAVRGFAKNDRVVIAGAGIIGASIAYHLAKRGARVTVLEKQRPGAGATEKSFAWINSFSKQPRSYYDLNLHGMAGWRRLSAGTGLGFTDPVGRRRAVGGGGRGSRAHAAQRRAIGAMGLRRSSCAGYFGAAAGICSRSGGIGVFRGARRNGGSDAGAGRGAQSKLTRSALMCSIRAR